MEPSVGNISITYLWEQFLEQFQASQNISQN